MYPGRPKFIKNNYVCEFVDFFRFCRKLFRIERSTKVKRGDFGPASNLDFVWLASIGAISCFFVSFTWPGAKQVCQARVSQAKGETSAAGQGLPGQARNKCAGAGSPRPGAKQVRRGRISLARGETSVPGQGLPGQGRNKCGEAGSLGP